MLDKGVKWLAEEAYSLGQNHIYNGYLRIYNRSNEELSKIFKKYDVKNKEVLTVLASSDQLFSCFYEIIQQEGHPDSSTSQFGRHHRFF